MSVATPRPIRVMNIIARLNIGGPAVAVTMLTKKLGSPDYESTLVCGTIEPGEGDMTYYARQHGVEPIIIAELGRSLNPLRDLATLRKVYRLIKDLQPDVVHTHAAKAGFVGRLAAKLAGVPVIIHTFHGHVFRGYFSPPKTRFFILLEQFSARISDAIITLSEGLRVELAEEYRITRKSRIRVLPLGLDLEAFACTPRKQGLFRQQWNIPADVPLIGIIGRVTAIKNHALFLEMAKRIHQQRPEIRFVVVGDGELRPEIEQRASELGLQQVVTFTGWAKEVPPVYSDLDVTVISSINEGTPVTLIEALAAGCPVVSTAVGGIPDLLDQGAFGRLVPPGDAQALADTLLNVVDQPYDVRPAQAAMLDRYGIDRLIKDMDSLYRGLLSKKRNQRSRR
jgi:glycosyltransferase involved in cell wall biosynthesis